MTQFSDLKVGDVVKMVRVPQCVLKSPPLLRDGMDGFKRVYQRAVARGSRLRVTWIDEYGFPWVEYQFKNKRGEWEYHAMQVEDDSYDII